MGGLSTVVKEADAKKQGIIVKKSAAHKIKGPVSTQDLIAQ